MIRANRSIKELDHEEAPTFNSKHGSKRSRSSKDRSGLSPSSPEFCRTFGVLAVPFCRKVLRKVHIDYVKPS